MSSTVHCTQQVFVEWNNLFSPFLLVLYVKGPIHWNEFFPIADGDQQSPIEIKTKEVKYDSSLRPLSIKYDTSSAKIISNSGHSFNVDFDDTEDKSGWLFFFFLVGVRSLVDWMAHSYLSYLNYLCTVCPLLVLC